MTISAQARRCPTALAVLAIVLLLSSPALAGGGPSQDSCQGLGKINVKCSVATPANISA